MASVNQREKLTKSELKRKILKSWQEIGIDDVRKCISNMDLDLLALESNG